VVERKTLCAGSLVSRKQPLKSVRRAAAVHQRQSPDMDAALRQSQPGGSAIESSFPR
jgi:hypothetical protein